MTNTLALAAPSTYVRLTHETGRGAGNETAQDVADYFWRCFEEYFQMLGIPMDAVPDWLHGKRLLEYGPGDVPGVAFLMLAHGARRVTCVDRFPLIRASAWQTDVLDALRHKLDPDLRARADMCFEQEGVLSSGFRPEKLDYVVSSHGISGLQNTVDFAYSRAVLEHVDDLDATIADFSTALGPGGITAHQVDLGSHGLHESNSLDFLVWPRWLWWLMYSGKGAPNRWRLDRYRAAIEKTELRDVRVEPVRRAPVEEVKSVRPLLPKQLTAISDDDLAVLVFNLVATKAGRT